MKEKKKKNKEEKFRREDGAVTARTMLPECRRRERSSPEPLEWEH